MAGAAGVMTGFAFPEVLVKVVSLYRAGKIDEAADVFYRFVPLMRFEFQEGIGMAIRKEVFRRRGVLADAATRAPGAVARRGHARGARSRARLDGEAGRRIMDLGLKGKVAMVAGASRGLGYAVARGARRRRRAGVDRARATRPPIDRRRASASPPRRTSRRSPTAVDVRVGRVDRRVARADDREVRRRRSAVRQRRRPAGRPRAVVRRRRWKAAFELLVLSAVRMVRLAVPSMKARGGGAIVVSTSSAVKEPIPNLALSNIVRSSVGAMSKTLANELAADNIRVNHLLPGRIDTDRVRELDAIRGKATGASPEDVRAMWAKTIPLGRYGKPEEFAARRGVPVLRRGALHHRRVAAGRRRNDQGRAVGPGLPGPSGAVAFASHRTVYARRRRVPAAEGRRSDRSVAESARPAVSVCRAARHARHQGRHAARALAGRRGDRQRHHAGRVGAAAGARRRARVAAVRRDRAAARLSVHWRWSSALAPVPAATGGVSPSAAAGPGRDRSPSWTLRTSPATRTSRGCRPASPRR